MTRSDDEAVVATATLNTPAPAAGQGQPAPAGQPQPQPEQGQPAPAAPAPAQPAGQPAPAAPAAPNLDAVAPTAPVVVLNNSTVQGLAADVADRLRRGFTVAEVGNLADATFPSSVVLFTPGNRVEEATAAKVAAELRIQSQPRPEAFEAPAGVVVVLTQDMQ